MTEQKSAKMKQQELRKLPSVDSLLQLAAMEQPMGRYGRGLVTDAIRNVLDAARQDVLSGQRCPSAQELAADSIAYLERLTQPTLQPVINASGVVIHTNLGRAPLSAFVIDAMRRVAAGYSNLEYDLEAGQRGSRYDHAEELLCRLTGAEAALLVNNNAGAVLLALTALAQGREVVISRSHLVEIGGGFRVPDVMRQSGATLAEVGTTNRTYVRDYAAALNEQTAMLLQVHTSNFRLSGFVHQVALADLVALGRQHGLCVMDDQGSGTLLDTSTYGLMREPTVQDSVEAGVDVITFSGDKLLGGPQAGIIVGRAAYVNQLKEHPLARALRMDKVGIAGVQANLLHYLKGEAVTAIPVWRMIAMTEQVLQGRASAMAVQLSQAGVAARVVAGRSAVGGGSLPQETLPTWLVALEIDAPDALSHRLRVGMPPVVGRIEGDRLVLDLRTVLSEQEADLVQQVVQAHMAMREETDDRIDA